MNCSPTVITVADCFATVFLMTFKIKLTHFKKLERSLLPLKKSMLTRKYKLFSQVSFNAMVKTSWKKLKKSTESWRIYVRVKGLSLLIITIILMVHALQITLKQRWNCSISKKFFTFY